MSGRKSSEVSALLARAGDARVAGNANFQNNFDMAIDLLESYEKRIKEICQNMSGMKVILNQNSYDEFQEESVRLESQFKNLLAEVEQKNYSSVISTFKMTRQKLDKRLKDADKENDRISNIIKNQNWYLDQEYSEADKLVGIYKNISSEKNALISSINSKVKDGTVYKTYCENKESQLQALTDSMEDLNQKAEKIVLCKQASEAKDHLQNAFNDIDKDIANKFMKDEYLTLKETIDDVKKHSDQDVMREVSKISEKISSFANKLDACYSEYKLKKEKAEIALAENERLLSVDTNYFFDSVDYAKNKNAAEKISALDYVQEYGSRNELVDVVKNGLDKLNELIKKEEFEQAYAQAAENEENINKVIEYAALLQEHRITDYYNTKDIRKILNDLGYEAGAYKIDGSVKNGWRIEATNANGARFDFTKIFVEDDGKVTINMYQKVAGDCANASEDISNAMMRNGMFVKKIFMEDGTVVVDRTARKAQTSTSQTQRDVKQQSR